MCRFIEREAEQRNKRGVQESEMTKGSRETGKGKGSGSRQVEEEGQRLREKGKGARLEPVDSSLQGNSLTITGHALEGPSALSVS